MLVEILGVLKEVPVPKDAPPVDAAYQLMVPADAVAPNVKTPGPQLESVVVVATVGIAYTVANTAVLAPATQPFTLAASA